MNVRGAQVWASNAELIADVYALHVRDRAAVVVADVTYGAGVWWRIVGEPDVRHGLALDDPAHYHDGVDFTALPEPDGTFDVVAYDPPYVAPGGRATSTVPEFHARYGIASTPSNPAELQQLINAGLTEVHRVLRPGGLALVKVMDYCWGGRYWPGAFLTLTHAATLDMALVDKFEHLAAGGRPQPKHRTRAGITGDVLKARRRAGRPPVDLAALGFDQLCTLAHAYGIVTERQQRHALRNHSTLYVLERTRPVERDQLALGVDPIAAVRADVAADAARRDRGGFRP